MACFQAVPFLVFRTFPQIVEVLTSVTYNQSMNTNLAIAEKSSPVYSMNLSLVNGRFAEVQLVANAVGVERGRNDPRTVAEQDGILYVLSECCAAGAKGSFTTDEETGAELPTIVCRKIGRASCRERVF